MSSAESNKMSKRTPSQDSNSELEKVWWEMEEIEPLTPSLKMLIEAKKRDDFIFENRNFDGTIEESSLK